jgi:hypothetical protein
MVLLLTAGQRHEQIMFEPLMERGAVKRRGRGRPRLRPDRVAGDKGYSSKSIRRYLRRRRIGVVIARQKRERRVRFDHDAYRKRNVVEMCQPHYPHRPDGRVSGACKQLLSVLSLVRLSVRGQHPSRPLTMGLISQRSLMPLA